MNNDQREAVFSDFVRYRPDLPATMPAVLSLIIANPGFMAVYLFRCQQSAVRSGKMRRANLLRSFCHMVTGADFVPGAVAGKGLLIQHPSGIVLGKGVVVGSGCTILQGCTLGEKLSTNGTASGYPTIGDNCVLGAGSVILGQITLGASCTVGANAVVIDSFSAGSTLIGAPAVKVSRKK